MPTIEKRHVRGLTVEIRFDDDGNELRLEHEFNDYVPVEIVDAYVADRKAKGWGSVVVVSDEHNPGPGGDDGATHYEEHLTSKGGE